MDKNVHQMNETERHLLFHEIHHEIKYSSDNWFFFGFLFGIGSAWVSGAIENFWMFLAIILPAALVVYLVKDYFVKRRARKWLDSFSVSSDSPASEQSSDSSTSTSK